MHDASQHQATADALAELLEKEGVLRPKQLSLLNLKTQGAC